MTLCHRIMSVGAIIWIATLSLDGISRPLSVHENVALLGGFSPPTPSAQALRIMNSGQWFLEDGLVTDWGTGSLGESHLVNLNSPGGLQQMQEFFAASLGRTGQETHSLLYFFGGPDAIYPMILFPRVRRVVLVGREAPGRLPDVLNLAAGGSLRGEMQSLRRAFRDVMRESYFITDNMRGDLRSFGTATILSLGVVAMGGAIQAVSPVTLDATGSLRMHESGSVRGVLIEFLHPSGLPGEILYLQQDLSNTHLADSNSAFRKYFERTNFDTAYFKAASFLPHSPHFSTAVDLVLRKVRTVVQSDNGIPVRDFQRNSSNWNLRFWGIYARPAPGFTAATVQPELTQLVGPRICAQGTAEQRSLWLRLGNTCTRGPAPNLGFFGVSWEGVLPFHYDYSAFSGGRVRRRDTEGREVVGDVVPQPLKRLLGNLLIAERVSFP